MRQTSKNEACKLGIDLGGYVATPCLPGMETPVGVLALRYYKVSRPGRKFKINLKHMYYAWLNNHK